MGKINKEKIWMDDVEDHDYDAAADYLSLHFHAAKVKHIVEELRKAPIVVKKAKYILRASQLPLLGKDKVHVKSNLKKFKKGKLLSPILLVRNVDRLIVADGYHRTCSVYCLLSEDWEISCKIV